MSIITKYRGMCTQKHTLTLVNCTYTQPGPVHKLCGADSWRLEENNNPIILLSFPHVFYYT